MDFFPTVSGTQTIMSRSIRVGLGSQPGYFRVSQNPDGFLEFLVPSGTQPNFYFENNLSVYCFGDEIAQQVMPKVVTLRQMGLMSPVEESVTTLYCYRGGIALDPQCLVKFNIDQRFIDFLFRIEEEAEFDTNAVIRIADGYNESTFRTHMKKFNVWMRRFTPILGSALVGKRGLGYRLNTSIRLKSLK